VTAWYNEPDPFAADWLRNLIAAGHIAPGIVDERKIQDVEAFELLEFTQCHFFAGIGVWSHALRRAGWPDDQSIWTGSCPCQPFSNAGKQKGFDDERHLWPYWSNLIEQCRPSTIVGEQVASALAWLDLVQADLEGTGYAFGASDLCAAGFDGAHIRQRLYFVGMGDSFGTRLEGYAGNGDPVRGWADQAGSASEASGAGGLADIGEQSSERDARAIFGTQEKVSSQDRQINGDLRLGHSDDRTTSRMADDDERLLATPVTGFQDTEHHTQSCGNPDRTDPPMLGRTLVDWLYCRDGKWRPVEPGTFPLVNEASQRVGRLRAYGNALDAETAATFCEVVKEINDEIGV